MFLGSIVLHVNKFSSVPWFCSLPNESASEAKRQLTAVNIDSGYCKERCLALCGGWWATSTRVNLLAQFEKRHLTKGQDHEEQ